MEDEHRHPQEDNHTQCAISKSKWVLIGFLIVIGYFLFTEHRAHVIAFFPYLLLLACPLMHIFMHHGHGHHHGDNTKDDKKGGA